jgi:hypothetical protein
VCRSLKEKSLASSVMILVNDIEDLREALGMLDTCFDWPEKYITEALEPITKFKGYKAFDSSAVREFYSLLRAAMMGARKVGLLHRLINDQTLPGILVKMPANDWRQWARERPLWIGSVIEEAFWTFVDQKWRDALNVAAAEPAGWSIGSSGPEPRGWTSRGQRRPRSSRMPRFMWLPRKKSPPGRRGWQEMHVCRRAGVPRAARPLTMWGIRRHMGGREGENHIGQSALCILPASRQSGGMQNKRQQVHAGLWHARVSRKARHLVA